MDQEIRTQEEISMSPSLAKQAQKQKNQKVLDQQQGQEAGEKEEDVEGKEEPQAEVRKNQRGPYRQYEDAEVILEKIRCYRTQRYPDLEIMKMLDNMHLLQLCKEIAGTRETNH